MNPTVANIQIVKAMQRPGKLSQSPAIETQAKALKFDLASTGNAGIILGSVYLCSAGYLALPSFLRHVVDGINIKIAKKSRSPDRHLIQARSSNSDDLLMRRNGARGGNEPPARGFSIGFEYF